MGLTTHNPITIDGPKTVYANWKTQHQLIMNATTGGTVNPAGGWYDQGQNVLISGHQQSGYQFNRWEGYGVGSYSGTSLYSSVTMNGPIVETAYFNVITHIITATAGAGGYISPSGNVSVSHGASLTFNIYPYTGYRIADVVVDGSSRGPILQLAFLNVITDHSISASFTPCTQTSPPQWVSASWGLDYKIEVSWDVISGTCNATGFNIYRRPSGAWWEFWQVVGSVSSGGAWFFVDYPPDSETGYYDYYVTTIDELGRESAPSPIATGALWW